MKKWFFIQSLVLLCGTVFAWYTIYIDYRRFYDIEGTIFKIADCRFPNPVTTPCFYGAWAFLIAFIWSVAILRKKDSLLQKWHQKFLVWFLVAGTLFAWGNFGWGLYKFIANQGKPVIGCSGQLVGDPFGTPCFYGAVLFLLALISGVVIVLSQRSKQPISLLENAKKL